MTTRHAEGHTRHCAFSMRLRSHSQSPLPSVSPRHSSTGVATLMDTETEPLPTASTLGFFHLRVRCPLTIAFGTSSGCSPPSSRRVLRCVSYSGRGIAWTFHAIGFRRADTEGRRSPPTLCADSQTLSFRCGLMFTSQAQMMRPTPPNKSLQPTPGSGSSSATRFTSLGPAWLSSSR